MWAKLEDDLDVASYTAGIGFDRTTNTYRNRDGGTYLNWDPQRNFLHSVILAEKAGLMVTFCDNNIDVCDGKEVSLTDHGGSFQDAFMDVVFSSALETGKADAWPSDNKYWIEEWFKSAPR